MEKRLNMRKFKILTANIFLIAVAVCSSFKNVNNNNFNKTTDFINKTNIVINTKQNVLSATTVSMTMGELKQILENKEEHYPFSDEFIEKYQQKSGGYIDNAKKAGIEISKEKHSPNQKWHWFESWFYPSIEEGTYTEEDDAKSKCYSRLLCPELLLWMYEACNVDLTKIKAAFNAAEKGKIDGIAAATLAKNMRACVSYEDILTGLGKM